MAAFKWGCGLSYLLLMMMAPVQVNAQTVPARDLYPKHIPDESRGVIVFQFKELEGVSLRCNFKYGPRNVDCTNGFELYTETLRPGHHVMDVTGIRVATGQTVGKVTAFFIVDEKMTFSIKASVRMEDVPKVCFSATRPALYKCKLDDGEWGDCTSCKTYPSLCPGSYQVQIRATSRINANVTTSTTQSFKIGFDGDFVNALLTYATENRRIRMCFNATREARYECRIGRGTWQSCTSCHSYPNLCPGHYFTEVRATSVHCPRISSTYEKNVIVGPSLEITRAGMDIDCNRGEYALESNIPSMWRCRVNSDSWHSCRNGMALPRLPVGTHTVTVEARSSCNQSEKVQTRFVARVPDGVSIDNCQVKSVGESLTATFSTCSLTQTFCKIDNGNYEACSSPYSIPSNVRPGPHRIHIKAELNGRELARHQCPFFKEMVLRINGSTEVTGHSVGACFQSNYPARFECRVDSNSWEPCTSCVEKNELCPGRHQFAVRGTARANSSVTARTSFPFSTTDRSIAVDVTSEVTGSSAEVCFTASRKSTFECSIDRGTWQSCTSCVNYDDICAGQHTVMVRAASRICSSVSGHSQTQFNIQSDLDITEAGMEVNCNSGVYSLATNRPARLRCRMNAGTWRTCSNGQSVNNMAAGVYSVEVEATLQCNTAIKATKTFDISVPGNVKVGAVQASKYEGGRMVITFDECKAAVYYCALDSGAETKCSSPFPITAVLSPGRHTVTVTARAKPVSLISDDSVENDLDSETVVVDIGLELRCSVVVKGPNAVVCFSASHDAHFWCKMDSGRWNNNCTSCTHYYDLCPGRHTATVNATAIGGFSYKNVTTCSFTVTTNELEIDSSAVVDGEDASICFESTRSVNYECQLDRGLWKKCSSCANYTGLCPGQHTVSVRGTSDFCPTVKGSVVQRFQTEVDYKFTKIGMRVECATGTYDLETSHPSTLRCRIGTSSWSSCSDGSMVSGLRLGSTQISVEASLRCDPSVKILERFTVAVPDNVVIPGIETSYNSDGYLVATFDTCPLATYWCTVDGGRRVRCTSPHVWSEKFQPGVHTLSIVPYSGSRTVGSPATTEFEEVFTSNSSVSVSGPNATVCFAASHNARFECRLNQGQWVQCSSCFTYTELCPGGYTVYVRAKALSDESIQMVSQSIFDIMENSIVISGVPKVIGGGLVRVCFSLSRQGNLQCKLNDDRWKDCSTCETFSDLCVGNHSVSVRAVSPVCDGVEGSSVVKFSIRPNLFVPGVTGVDGDTAGETCSADYEHKITVSKPSTLKCRIVCETE